ncbi:MAG: hypothetical protein RBR42_00390 [Desulfomicrobium sp.]|jgi:hypothetical protein|nr:hypothetical protein [Desulfomicrobium sp.]
MSQDFSQKVLTKIIAKAESIFKESSAASTSLSSESSDKILSNEIFFEASQQLSAILETTENIMTLIEKYLEQNKRSLALLDGLGSCQEVQTLQIP